MKPEDGEGPGQIRQLRDPQPDINTPPPPSRARGLHRVAINALSVFAIAGIFLALLLITVDWDDESRGWLVTVLVLVFVGLVTSAAIAVFVAACETHRHGGSDKT